MDIREMFQKVLIQSGQFLFTTENIEMKPEQFAHLVRQCVATYNRYSPEVRKLWIPQLELSRQYTFQDAPRNADGTLQSLDDLGVPDWISDATPVKFSGTLPFLLREEYQVNPELQIKETLPFQYRKPTLTVSVSAKYEVTAVYYHKVLKISSTQTTHEKYVVETIDDSDEFFFDLLTARFMKSTGRSRRAFTIEDLPISVEGDLFIQEGKDMEEQALIGMQENASIELAM